MSRKDFQLGMGLTQERVHVHVHHATGEAKFWLEPTIALAQNFGLSQRNIAAARRLVVEH